MDNNLKIRLKKLINKYLNKINIKYINIKKLRDIDEN